MSNETLFKELLKDFKVAEITPACKPTDKDSSIDAFISVTNMLASIKGLKDEPFYNNVLDMLAHRSVELILNSSEQEQTAFFNHFQDKQICKAQLAIVLEASKKRLPRAGKTR